MSAASEKRLTLEQALHAMQTGVKLVNRHAIQQAEAKELRGVDKTAVSDWHEDDHKHLRVGVNNALLQCGMLQELLVRKGIITQEEAKELLRVMVNEEVERYEKELEELLGQRPGSMTLL